MDVKEGFELEGLTDRIAETFVGKKVLISGGTGFIGKVLVEKLLRVCPKIGGLILIVRQKKGKEPKQRVEEIFSNPLFGPLVSERGVDQLLPLVTAVNGDMREIDLGLSEKDRLVCQTANIIVHSAANVRFDEGIKTAVLLNTRGTKYMLELGKQCPNLELFIHVSTAYCHPEEKVLEERLYSPPNDPHEVIHNIEAMDDESIDILTPKLLGEFPNTYAYSKALAEALVEETMEHIPAVIVRPSVVIPIYSGPVKGWTDNINGPMGIFIGAGKGVIRTMYGNDQGSADFVPVDVVINAIMATVWDCLKNGNKHKVINLTTSDEIFLTWKELVDIGRNIVEKRVPFDNVVWYPGGSMTSSRLLHRTRSFLFHWIPAFFIDTLLYCLGYKPVLVRIQTRISKSFEVFEYYTNNQWSFKSDSMKAVRTKFNALEKERYKMDTEGLDIEKYFEDGCLAARRYILKEKDENIPRARTHMKIMWYLDLAVKYTEVLYHQIIADICKKYRKEYHEEFDTQLFGAVENEICAKVVEELKLPVSIDEFKNQLLTMCNQLLPTAPVAHGAERLLMHLYDYDIPMALATNSTEIAVRLNATARPKLFGMFHHMVSITDPEVYRGKPNPDIYLVAAERFPDKPKPEKCLVFEDTAIGVKAAKEAGMQVVMIPPHRLDREHTRFATIVLKTLMDFKPELFGLPPFEAPPVQTIPSQSSF